MKVNSFKAQLKSFYKIFIAPPKQWVLPKKSQILIYDAQGSEFLVRYMSEYSVEILHLRGESINVPCFLLATLRYKFWKGQPLKAYADAYIELTSPTLAVTFIDNNVNFYTVASRFSSVKTIFLQNGLRGGAFDVLTSLVKSDKYHVDHMLVFNSSFGKAYQKYISGEYIPIGSLKNNSTPIRSNEVAKNTVLFISQFRPSIDDSKPFTFDQMGLPVDWNRFYSAELKILPFLRKWCNQNNKFLRVAGCTSNQQEVEREFYAMHLDGCNWEFVPKLNPGASYTLLDKAEIVVFIDSALGFESIGRGKKTAGLSCRARIVNDNSLRFGWPATLPDNGPFWTGESDNAQFMRVMDYLNAVGSDEWEKVRQIYSSELMELDVGNTQFSALLAELLPSA